MCLLRGTDWVLKMQFQLTRFYRVNNNFDLESERCRGLQNTKFVYKCACLRVLTGVTLKITLFGI